MKNQFQRGRRKVKKKQKVTRKMRARIRGMFLVIGIFMVVGIWRIISMIHDEGDKYSKEVLDNQSYTSKVLASKRGKITDRNGTVLAYSQKVYNLILDPKVILSDKKDRYREPTLKALTECFPELTRAKLDSILTEKPNSQYEKLLRELTDEQIQAFQALQNDTKNNPYIKGVWFEESYIRQYPYSSLACHVLGFSSVANGGELGLEMQYNDYLSGTDGIEYGYVDEGLNIERTRKQAVDGNDIITTLDFTVQNILEKHVKAFDETFGAKKVAMIVMDPGNGEILGMASSSSFDLNNPRDLTGILSQEQIEAMGDDELTTAMYSMWNNYCVSSVYEPGSTMKCFTVATALDEGLVTTEDSFDCHGYEEVGGHTIHCHNRSGHGTLTLEEGLIQSCNPAMMQIAARMGAPLMSLYQQRYGFGKKTGIDLPGEENGLMIDGSVMSVSDLATNAFGQNLNVNMVQMAAAYCAVINGGYYYKPHIVKQIETANGELVKRIEGDLIKQVLSEHTSSILRNFLEDAVEIGLARRVKVEDYSIAGKTGTAQKQPRDAENYVVSFIGHAPAQNPKFMIYVLIDEPSKENCPVGSSAPAVTLSKEVLADLLPYMNVFRNSDTGNEPVPEDAPVEAHSRPPLED